MNGLKEDPDLYHELITSIKTKTPDKERPQSTESVEKANAGWFPEFVFLIFVFNDADKQCLIDYQSDPQIRQWAIVLNRPKKCGRGP